MNAQVEALGADTARLQRLLPGPIERIWDYLTDPELRGHWLAPGPMEPHPGGQVALHFRHADLSPEPGAPPPRYAHCESGVTCLGRVLVWEPPTRLAHTWGEETGESEVCFELEPRADGQVLLTITHRRLPDRDTFVGVASGWHAHTDILLARLAGRTPGNFWRIHGALEREYAQRFASD